VLTFGLSPVIRSGLRNPGMKERKKEVSQRVSLIDVALLLSIFDGRCASNWTDTERWGAGVEYHFQEI